MDRAEDRHCQVCHWLVLYIIEAASGAALVYAASLRPQKVGNAEQAS